MPSLFRRSLAEALGTFALVFIGVGVGREQVTTPTPTTASSASPLAHALVLSVMITATMAISGGHLNPAVTVGLLVARRIDATHRGGLHRGAAGRRGARRRSLLKAVYPPERRAADHARHARPRPTTSSSSQAIVIEAVLTFFLVSAVFGTCVNAGARPRSAGFGVGLVLLFDILVGGPLTGAAMNPARAFGPALVSGQWVAHVGVLGRTDPGRRSWRRCCGSTCCCRGADDGG